MITQTPAEFIIKELGGLTRTAELLSTDGRKFPVTTVQGWKNRGRIPQDHWQALIDAARAVGKKIDLPMFLNTPAGVAQ